MKKCRRIGNFLVFVLAFLTNIHLVHAQSMSGTYSIGATSSDYSSFSQAVDSLTLNGVSAPVILNVKNGTYNENISIGSISGASSANTITFQSLSADSNTVIITNTASGSSNNYTIRLNGADYITFKQITIRSVGAQYATAVQIQANAIYNHFENCILEGSNVSSSSSNLSLLYCASGSNSYNSIKNCVFKYGSYGIYYYGSSYPDIQNNTFSNQYYRGIYIGQCSHADMIGNTINSGSAYSSYGAVELSNSTYSVLSKNRINMANGSNGLYISYSSGASVSNNCISVGGSSGSVDAIYCYDCSSMDFYYNSVSMRRSGSSNTCFYNYKSYSGSSSNIQLQNNIFANYGGGFCVDYNSTSAINLSDYNDFYTTGSYVGRWNGTSYNLSSWKLNTYKDANSVSIDPVFVAFDDLHVQNYLLDDKGLAISSVTVDIDGESRSLSTADIGADEWTTPASDAGITDIDDISTLCIVNDSVFVTLKNFGSDTLISVQINWRVNSLTQIPFSWTGSLVQGQNQGPFSIGYYDFSLGTQYSIEAWTSSPNGQTEGFSYNDQDAISNKYKAMSGTYSIGLTGADYQTFNAAITDLVNGGVCGPVTFQVKSGIYNEEVIINSISGVSSTSTVTFQSQTQDSTDVTLTYTPTAGGSSTLKFNGCDYVTFRKMTIKAVGSQYATAIRLQNSSHNNSIEHCIVEGSGTNNTGADLSVIYSSSSCNNFKLACSRIINGSYGLYFNGGSSLLIENNEFVNQYFHPIYITSVSSPDILGNSISTNSTQSSFSGIYLNSCGSYAIESNRISVFNAGNYGIYLSSSDGGLCANNFIFIGGSSGSAYGFYSYNSSSQNFYYNTVNIARSGSSNAAFYQYTGYSYSSSNIHLQNNNFANYSGGYCMNINNSSSINVSDYNNFYSSGSYIGYWAGNSYNLSSWKSNTYKDANTVSIDPAFVSNTDLHVQNFLLDNKGYGLFGVTTDIDGEIRDLFTPDIGADEWTTPQNDAGITSVDASSTLCIVNDSVFVTIKNYGTDTLISATINWKVNNVAQTAFLWTGSLLQGDFTGPFSIGYYDFNLGVQYSIDVWSTNPNGQSDGFAYNDHATLNNKYKAMSGNYTIGGSNPDYANFNAAVTDLVNGGVCGPVIFDVRDGIYNEQVSIGQIAGTNGTNTVLFRSQSNDSSKVTLTHTPNSSSDNSLVFNGCDYVTFKHMKIRAVGAQYATPVRFNSSAYNNALRNCIIEGASTNSSSSNMAVIYSSGGSNNTEISHCIINNGSQGLYFSSSSNINIEYNQFNNQYYRMLYLVSCSSADIIANTFQTNSTYTDIYAMYLSACSSYEILNNRIDLSNYGYCGVYLDQSNGGTMANNFIHIGAASGSAYGIYSSNSSSQNFYYNTVNITRSGSSNAAFYQYTGYSQSSSNLHLQNNIFANYGGGYSIYIGNPSSINISDYNNFYTTGSYVGYWNGNSYNLSNWKSNTYKDANTISIDPVFVSNTDLHVQNYLLDNKGYGLYGVTEDIDGETRDLSSPDIGADEWTTPNSDAGITAVDAASTLCIVNDSVFVTMKNYGEDTLVSATINWKVNAISQTPFSWSGSLAQGASEGPFSIGYYDFDLGMQYSIDVWTSNPNGQSDGFAYNDDATLNNKYKAMSGIYTIGGTNPDYSTITAAITDLTNGGVCGPVTFKLRTGTYNEQLTISSVSGVSSVNTVTFESEAQDSTKVIITHTPTSSSDATIMLTGADYLRFRQLTIKALGTQYATAVNINSSSRNISIENSIIEGANTNSTSTNLGVIYIQGTSNMNHSIENNRILKGSYGIYVYSGSYIDIKNNEITNQYRYSLYLTSVSRPEIIGNSINSNTAYSSYNNMYLISCSLIEVVSNRLIVSIGEENIYLSDVSNGNIYNNFIYMAGSGGGFCIYNYNSSYIHFYYNSINMTRSSSGSYGIYFNKSYYGTSTGNILINNNISATSGGSCIYLYETSMLSNCDYNNYYKTGSYIGYYNGNITTLSSWQSSTGKDANTLSVDPNFVSNTDLHVCNSSLNNAGIPISGIISDIDGEIRNSSTPDIGADEFNTILDVNLGPDTVGCGSLVLDAGNPGATYLWSTNATTQTITVTSSDTIWVKVSNACGSDTDTVIVTISSPPGASISSIGSTTVCQGDTVNLVANSGNAYTYQWFRNDNIISGATGVSYGAVLSGSYKVKVIDSNACASVSSNIGVSTMSLPTATVTAMGNTGFCLGDSVLLKSNTATGLTYQWLKDGNIISGATDTIFYAKTLGNYAVKLTNSNNCSKISASVYVNVNTVPSINIVGNNHICQGDSVELQTGSGSGLSYVWYKNNTPITGAYNASYQASAAGAYTVKVTNAYNCSATSSPINLSLYQLPNAQITMSGNGHICQGDSIALQANNASAYSHQWIKNNSDISNANDSTYYAGQSGLYSVRITDNHGCSNTASPVSINVHNNPSAALISYSNPVVCEGDSVKITANSGSGLTYQWYKNNNAINNATSQNYFAHSTGVYHVMVSNTYNCSASSASLNVIVNQNPVANISQTGALTFCAGDSVIFNANTGNGLHYQWQKNGINLSTDTLYTMAAKESGTYNVVVINNAGCSAISSPKTVIKNPRPQALISMGGNGTICQGDSLQLQGNTGSGYTYKWYKNNNLIPAATDPVIYAKQSGNYTLEVSNSSACIEISAPVLVIVNPSPQAKITANGSTGFCYGDSVELYANIGTNLSYQWYKNGLKLNAETYSFYVARQQGLYSVEIRNASNCSTLSDPELVSVSNPPVANITANGNTTFCAGDSVQLFASSGVGYTYQWRINGSDIFGAVQSVYIAKNSGQFTVLISNATNCSALSNALDVTVKPSPDATLSADGSTTLCDGQSVNLSVSVAAGLTYKWMKNGLEIIGVTSAFYNVTETGVYTAIVSNAECTSFSEAMQVIVNPNPQVDLGQDTTLCGHYSIVLEAGLGFDSYLWSDGSVGSTLLVDSSGIGYSTKSFSVFVTKNNCQGSDLINISFKPCTGIEEQFGTEQVLVYPNPSQSVFIVKLTKYQHKNLIMRVLDTQGQIILQRDLLVQKEQIQEEIDLGRESKGVYILQLINDKEARNLKLIRN